jgi:tetratricopeptide (TPR) repeat protein
MVAIISAVLLANFAFQLPSDTAAPPATESITAETRGDIMMAYKRYRDAIDYYQPGAATSATLANKAGIAYQQLQDLSNARKYYEKAIKLNPKFAQAINNLGTVYFTQKSYRRSISMYRRAIRLDPKMAAFESNLGTALFARNDFKGAEVAYRQAVALDPEIFDTRGTTGTTIQDQSVENRAMQHYYMARVLALSGARERALQYIRKALEEGFKDKEKFLKEPEFAAFQDDPEFKLILAQEQKVL